MNLYELEVITKDLHYNHRNVILESGYPTIESAGYFVEAIDTLHHQLLSNLNIRSGFMVFQNISVEPSFLIVENQKFSTGRIISADLKGSTTVAFFVCTIGEGFEEFLKPVFESSPAEGFLVDLLGSMIIEAVADYTEEKIIQLASEKYGFKCTNRFSPGYCNWSVEEQHKLFTLFPTNFCGISLSKSALMQPRKSVSGVIGLGNTVRKRQYQCSICDMEHCFRRKKE
jgi:hypothetical protein